MESTGERKPAVTLTMTNGSDKLADRYYAAVTPWIQAGRPEEGRANCLRLAIEYRNALKARIYELQGRPSSVRAERYLARSQEFLSLLEKDFASVFGTHTIPESSSDSAAQAVSR